MVQAPLALGEFRAQWQASTRLRLGVWLVLLILALYGLQAGLDLVEFQRVQVKTLDGELSRLRALAKERDWTDRAAEASRTNAALDSMAWAEADLALTEAAFQDWLRTVPPRLGLKTLALTIARVEQDKASAETGRQGAGAGQGLSAPAGYVALRARVSFELQRAPLMAFLSECARSEHSVVVERLSLRGLSQPPMAELDLRILARKSEVAP
jgi:hypothetical protein